MKHKHFLGEAKLISEDISNQPPNPNPLSHEDRELIEKKLFGLPTKIRKYVPKNEIWLTDFKKSAIKIMRKELKSTNKKFYKNWTREQLIKELCRLNQLLLDCLKILNKESE